MLPDHLYDKLALSIDVRKSTARPDLDEWFREHFSPHTGMWVLNHPERDKLDSLYRSLGASRRDEVKEPSLWEVIILIVLGHHTR